MFGDLRDFTAFAESVPADTVIDVLNRYVSDMSDAILDNGGTLVAYMGDGIMAVFGAPIEMAGHADCAVAAAREMLHSRLPDFNGWLKKNGLGDGFRMGVGLSSGPIVSGTVGSERRLEYTTVGDTVRHRRPPRSDDEEHAICDLHRRCDATSSAALSQRPRLRRRARCARKAVEGSALDAGRTQHKSRPISRWRRPPRAARDPVQIVRAPAVSSAAGSESAAPTTVRPERV